MSIIAFDPRWRGMKSNRYLGQEWQSYIAGPDMIRMAPSDLPPEPGVYFLFDGDRLIYVGQSQTIRGRVKQHQGNGRVFTSAGCVIVPTDLCVAVETAYIHALRPAGNSFLQPPVFFQHFYLLDAIIERWKPVPLFSTVPGEGAGENAEQSTP